MGSGEKIMEMSDYDYDCLLTGEFEGVDGVIENDEGCFYV